jgi:hypothetical protein
MSKNKSLLHTKIPRGGAAVPQLLSEGSSQVLLSNHTPNQPQRETADQPTNPEGLLSRSALMNDMQLTESQDDFIVLLNNH